MGPGTTFLDGFATLVGGVFYPVKVMPDWLQVISRLLPVIYSLNAMRQALLAGASWRALAPDLLILAAFAAASPFPSSSSATPSTAPAPTAASPTTN